MSHQFTRIYYDVGNSIIAVETADTEFHHDFMKLDGGIIDRVEEFDIDAIELTERQVLDRYIFAGYSEARAIAQLDELKILSAANNGAEVEPIQSAVIELRNIRVSASRTTFFAREFRHASELLEELEFDSVVRVRFKLSAVRPTPISRVRDAANPKRPGDTEEEDI